MAFILLLLYIVTIYIRPQEWIQAVYGWPLIDILAIATAVCLLFKIGARGFTHIKKAPNMLLFAFFGCVLMSHISHIYVQGTIDSFTKFAPNVIMFFLLVNTLVTEKRIKTAIWLIIILTFILGIEGILQYYRGYGWAGQTPILAREAYRIRWIGIFNDPNDLALLYVVGASFLIAFIFGNTNILVKLISVSMLAIIGRALYYTNSRGGFLAMAASIGIYFLFRLKNKFLAFLIGSIMAFSIVVIGPSRMSQISASEASAFGRIDAWYEGFQMLKSAPLFGLGYGMWTDYHSLGAHNSYILVAAEEGIIGLFFWMGLIYISLVGLYKVMKVKPEFSSYTLGAITGIFGFLSAAYFLSRSYTPLFYIIIALACSIIYTFLSKKEILLEKKDFRNIGFVTVGILMMVWLSMRVSLRLVG